MKMCLYQTNVLYEKNFKYFIDYANHFDGNVKI